MRTFGPGVLADALDLLWARRPAGWQMPLAANVGDNPMKQITAVVKPDKLDAVARAVEQAGAHGLTATEVRGFGQEYRHMSAVRPAGRELVQPELRIDVL